MQEDGDVSVVMHGKDDGNAFMSGGRIGGKVRQDSHAKHCRRFSEDGRRAISM